MNLRRAMMLGLFTQTETFNTLDAFQSNTKAAFSTSRLFSSSTLCLRLRRSADDVEQDFSFIGNFLDTDGIVSFLDGADGFITTWYDQSGNNNHFQQSTKTAQPKITLNLLNGLPGLSFDGTDDSLKSVAFADSSFDHSLSIFSLLNKSTGTDFTVHDSNDNGNYYADRDATGAMLSYNNSGFTGGNLIEAVPFGNSNHNLMLETFIYDGANRKIFINGSQYSQIASTESAAFSGSMYAGSYMGNSFYWPGQMFVKIYMNSALDFAGTKAVNDKVAVDFGQVQKTHIYFVGNSLTFGLNSSSDGPDYPGTSYPSQLVSSLGGPINFDFTNNGQSGATTEQLNTNLFISTGSPAIYQTNGFSKKNILVFLEGRNSMAAGDDAATAYTSTLTLLAKYRAMQVYNHIIVCTCEASLMVAGTDYDVPNTSGVTTNQFEAQRLAYNESIRHGIGADYDAVADVGADAIIGNLAEIGNLTYFDNIGVHLTDAGYSILSSIVKPVLSPLL